MATLGIRLFSGATVVLLRNFLLHDTFLLALYGLLYAHYALATAYSWGQIRNLGGDRRFRLPLLALLAVLVLALVWRSWLFIPFIGMHIALSEVYLSWGGPRPVDGRVESYNLLRLGLYISGFSTLVFGLHWIVPVAFWGACLAWFLANGFHRRGDATLNWTLPYDAAGLAMLGALHFSGTPITQAEIVFYHVVTWLMHPLLRLERTRGLPRFLAANVALAAAFTLLGRMGVADLKAHIPLWGTAHFVLTLGTSRLNPAFLTRVFYPARAAA